MRKLSSARIPWCSFLNAPLWHITKRIINRVVDEREVSNTRIDDIVLLKGLYSGACIAVKLCIRDSRVRKFYAECCCLSSKASSRRTSVFQKLLHITPPRKLWYNKNYDYLSWFLDVGAMLYTMNSDARCDTYLFSTPRGAYMKSYYEYFVMLILLVEKHLCVELFPPTSTQWYKRTTNKYHN